MVLKTFYFFVSKKCLTWLNVLAGGPAIWACEKVSLRSLRSVTVENVSLLHLYGDMFRDSLYQMCFANNRKGKMSQSAVAIRKWTIGPLYKIKSTRELRRWKHTLKSRLKRTRHLHSELIQQFQWHAERSYWPWNVHVDEISNIILKLGMSL